MPATKGFAPAKVNLTLHVTGRRADGYHLLDSLVVFADVGDWLEAEPAEALSLTVTGPTGGNVPADEDNLVMRAARLLDPKRGAALYLHKELPAAAGIGGGSSDAAAALRLLSALWDVPLPPDTALLGADVPMCLARRAARVTGVGEVLTPAAGLLELPAVLVNPGVPVATPAVFAALERRDNPPMPAAVPVFESPDAAARWLSRQRNDLAAPARRVAPVLDDVMAALGDALLTRMSGSGATCFGLYPDRKAADAAAARIAAAEPGWWVRATLLNAGAPLRT